MSKQCKTDSCKPKQSPKKLKVKSAKGKSGSRREPTIYRDIRDCNLIIEVRDARLPVSSQVRFLHSKFGSRQKVIFLTKCDLVSEDYLGSVLGYLRKQGFEVFPVWPTDSPTKLQKLFASLTDKFTPAKSLLKVMRVLIIGLPNVGKSTIINTLRKKKVTRVGDVPGVTKGRQWIKLSPHCYLMDTPGVATLASQGKDEKRLNFAICRMISQKEYEFAELVSHGIDLSYKSGLLKKQLRSLAHELETEPEELLQVFESAQSSEMGFLTVFYEYLIEAFSKRFGLVLQGGRVDEERASQKCFQWIEKFILPDLDLDHIIEK